MAYKQKKVTRSARNRYLRPGALARLRDSRTTNRTCRETVKKRRIKDLDKDKVHLSCQSDSVVNIPSPFTSPVRTIFQPLVGPFDAKLHKIIRTPKSPCLVDLNSQSRLELLPMDLLVKILCHLHHDQLKAVFHVSQRIRKAVLIAREWHFNYKTPDRSRQEMLRTKTPLPVERWPFMSKGDGKSVWRQLPCTPRAPRNGHRPPQERQLVIKQVAAVLFPDSLPSRFTTQGGFARTVFKSIASNRVLFYEDELCHAVAQNKLC